MDMMKIEFNSLVLAAKAVKKNIERFFEHEKNASYAAVAKRSVELLIEEMEEFQRKYIEVDDD